MIVYIQASVRGRMALGYQACVSAADVAPPPGWWPVPGWWPAPRTVLGLHRRDALTCVSYAATSVVYPAMALAQLALILSVPAWYSRRRTQWIVGLRLTRLVLLMMFACEAVGQRPGWLALMSSVTADTAGGPPPPLSCALGLLLSFSGEMPMRRMAVVALLPGTLNWWAGAGPTCLVG